MFFYSTSIGRWRVIAKEPFLWHPVHVCCPWKKPIGKKMTPQKKCSPLFRAGDQSLTWLYHHFWMTLTVTTTTVMEMNDLSSFDFLLRHRVSFKTILVKLSKTNCWGYETLLSKFQGNSFRPLLSIHESNVPNFWVLLCQLFSFQQCLSF